MIGKEPTLEKLQGQELVELFHRLMAGGIRPPERAAAAAQKYGAQIRELAAMGFSDCCRMLELLGKYNGRMLRVANALAEASPETAPRSSGRMADVDEAFSLVDPVR